MDFSDQVAIITGSSSGIGAAAAIGMARGGAKVVVNFSKSSEAANAVVAACEEAGGEAIAVGGRRFRRCRLSFAGRGGDGQMGASGHFGQ